MTRPSYEGVRFDSAESAPSDGVLVRRWDVGEIVAPQRTREGFIRTEGILTRSGVFEYTKPDGSKFKELRHPDEVFDRESMKSFALVPLTNEHPPDNLTPETVKDFQTGSVGSLYRDGDVVKADILITDKKAIDDAEAGKTGLSCGYHARVFDTPGVYVDRSGVEHKFDTVQKMIRGNHVAQTHHPRAGDVARMRMDSKDAVMRDEKPAPGVDKPKSDSGETNMAKISLNGTSFEVPDEVAKRLDALEGEVKAAKKIEPRTEPPTDLATQKRLDEKEGELAAAKAEIKKRTDAEAANESKAKEQSVKKETLHLYLRAAPILKKSLDELVVMDTSEVIREVVKKEAPTLNLEGKSDDYLKGVFMHLTESRTDSVAALNAIVGAVTKDGQASAGIVRQDGDIDKRLTEARQRSVERLTNAWKPKEAAKT